MKVRILSGNQTGAVLDLPQAEATAALDTGFAEVIVDSEPVEEAEEPKAEEAPHPAPRGGSSARRAAARAAVVEDEEERD